MKVPVHCAHNGTADPATLKPNPRNPKKHSKRKIELYAKIIKESGWRRSIVVSKRSGYIVHGHGAQQAALMLGLKSVPIDRQIFKSDAQEEAAMLADNWLAEVMLEYDPTLTSDLVNELKDEGFDLELAGVLESLVGEQLNVKLKDRKIMPPPKMVWVLVGIPTVKFGTINSLIEKLGRVPSVLIESSQTDGVKS